MEAGVSHLVDDSGPAGVVLSLRKVGEQVRMEEFGRGQLEADGDGAAT